MSINDNIKFLENIKQGFRISVPWIKCRSEITRQTKNEKNYLIDPTFRNIYILFVLSFKNSNNYPSRNSFDKYYMSLVEIKDFNVLIDNKPCFEQPVKNKQGTYEKLIEMSKMMIIQQEIYYFEIDYLYHQNHYKIIGVDLSRQTNISIPQKINFTGNLEEDDGATMFFIAEKQQKTILNFSLDSLIK